jgi:hypothetical protein
MENTINTENITNETDKENLLNENNCRQDLPGFITDNMSKASSWMKFFAVFLLVINGIILIFIIMSLVNGIKYGYSFKRFVKRKNIHDLETAFKLQKKFWRTLGWIIIVYTSLSLIFIIDLF